MYRKYSSRATQEQLPRTQTRCKYFPVRSDAPSLGSGSCFALPPPHCSFASCDRSISASMHVSMEAWRIRSVYLFMLMNLKIKVVAHLGTTIQVFKTILVYLLELNNHNQLIFFSYGQRADNRKIFLPFYQHLLSVPGVVQWVDAMIQE